MLSDKYKALNILLEIIFVKTKTLQVSMPL